MDESTISLCLIVKNEEAALARCLASAESIVDEIIVVDTGSTDQTKKIAAAFTKHIYDFHWSDNFADARNFGLDKANCHWIMWLDADEELDQHDGPKLKPLLQNAQDPLLFVHLINYVGERPHEYETFHLAQSRLFRNGMGIKFKYSIHEMLDTKELSSDLGNNRPIQVLPVKVHHYGYMNVPFLQNKHERNFRMLKQALAQNDQNPWLEYHLASEYYRTQQYEQAFHTSNLSILHFLRSQQIPPSIIYQLKYAIILALGSIDGAWPGIEKAIELYPDYVDLHFYKGMVFFLKTWYLQAIETFDHCLELGDDHVHHLTHRGTGSFLSLYYKGLCYEKLGDEDKAIQAYSKATTPSLLFPPAAKALQRLAR